EFAEFFHHLLHLGKFVEQRVHFGHGHAAAFGNTLTAAGIKNLRSAALLSGHSANNSFHAAELSLLFRHVGALEHFRAARKHADDRFERSYFFHLAELFEKIFQRELALAHFLFHALGL